MENPISQHDYNLALLGIDSPPASLDTINHLSKHDIQRRIQRLKTGYISFEHENLEAIEFWVRIESLMK